MTTTAAKGLLTLDDFFRMNPEGRCELVHGEIVTMSPKKWLHGRLTYWLVELISAFLREHPIGRLAIEAGVLTERNPDSYRIPDLVYVSFARWSLEAEAAVIESEEVLPVAPELVIEIRSPDDRWSDVEEKIDEYRRAGVDLVWILDPKRQAVHVYRVDGTAVRLASTDSLTGEHVLPGFAVTVEELLAGKRHA